MKNNRHGPAAILTDNDYSKIRRQIITPKYKLLLDLAWYTGERWGALLQLKVEDVYMNGQPRQTVTFRANTRKARPDGRRETRQVPVHPNLAEVLTAYKPKHPVWLFPGRDGETSIKLRIADKILRNAVAKAGLESKGISTHSTRRSFITRLYNKGTDLFTIRRITGHKSYQVLERYIEADDDRLKGAIFGL